MLTMVVGASPNPSRYSYKAVHRLLEEGHEVVPIGIKRGSVAGIDILDIRSQPQIDKEVEVITLYVAERNLQPWHQYLLSMKPKRIIFNPGAENLGLEALARSQGIETINACTLVMLSVGAY